MTTTYRYILVFLILILNSVVFHKIIAQPQSKVQLAYEYYQSNEYQKAFVEFEGLYKKTRSRIYLNYMIKCVVELKDYDQAERMIKKQIRKNKHDLLNYVELGNIYKLKKDEKRAEEQYQYVIKNIPANRNVIMRIANSFLSKREYGYAETTYLRGRELIPYAFHYEMANVYAYQRKSQELINEYLDLLVEDPESQPTVMNHLQSRMNSNYDENFKHILKRTLIKRIQKNAGEYIYNETLIWYYVQEKDFRNAIIQAKALDRRMKEGGRRLVELGGFAASNGMYETAKEAYLYVIKKDKGSVFYRNAKLAYLNVLYIQVEKGQIRSKDQIEDLEKQYLDAIEEFGRNYTTIDLIKDFAHLQAFYLNKNSEAVTMLKSIIKLPDLKPLLKGSCKIELADILLLQENVWEATIEYAQAEKMNKGNPIGYEARFKRAKLAYYMGNFEWAQAQLDVLKGSTSQLIANDAFHLSMLIKDNIGMDTTSAALKYFSRAEMYLVQNKEELAMLVLDTLEKNYKTNPLIDEVLFLKAKIFEKQGKIDKAIENLKKIEASYAFDILGDDAIYKLAQMNDYQKDNKTEAMKYYKKIIFDYPGSIYVTESRKRFRILKDDAPS
ncbi:MAG: tetratricopeptide repeat protein [Bacteroidota bacterium]